MSSVCLYLKVHIPHGLKYFAVQEMKGHATVEKKIVQQAIDKLTDECYAPANKLVHELIHATGGKFKINFSISGTAIELLSMYRPDVLESFKVLANTGSVSFLAETYYNSLSWLHSKNEFRRQVEMHHQKIETTFGISPVVFRNTELIYNNELAKTVAAMGYKGILCEGLDTILNGRTPNQLYAAPGNADIAVLLRNTRLSDDIAFRFDDLTWNEQPLTAEKFAGWIHTHGTGSNINLYFDYETFGIHKKKQTGIFDFLQNLPAAIMADESWSFKTAEEVIIDEYPKDIFDSPQVISWQNKSPENCIWSENSMQRNALYKIYHLENTVKQIGCGKAVEYWGSLQSADHFYKMMEHENMHSDFYAGFANLKSPSDHYNDFKNVVTAFEIHLIQQGLETSRMMRQKANSYHLYGATN